LEKLLGEMNYCYYWIYKRECLGEIKRYVETCFPNKKTVSQLSQKKMRWNNVFKQMLSGKYMGRDRLVSTDRNLKLKVIENPSSEKKCGHPGCNSIASWFLTVSTPGIPDNYCNWIRHQPLVVTYLQHRYKEEEEEEKRQVAEIMEGMKEILELEKSAGKKPAKKKNKNRIGAREFNGLKDQTLRFAWY
jgi:hypothetical protein